MGLDMHLKGVDEDGTDVELGYWRKHPDLHGFFVNEFGGGVDECQRIPLLLNDLIRALETTKANKLPKTTGFFFGQSQAEDKPETIKILEKAIKWVSEDGFRRTVYYRASW